MRKNSKRALPVLKTGYAETSTRRRPKEPETVVVGSAEISASHYVGEALIDGRLGWLAFKVKGKKRYYFQYQPW